MIGSVKKLVRLFSQKEISENLIKYKAIEKWDGVLPHVTSGGIPLIQLK